MQLDTKPLIDAIDRLIAKANSDLENSLESEGYVAAKVYSRRLIWEISEHRSRIWISVSVPRQTKTCH